MNRIKICEDIIEAELQQLLLTNNVYAKHCNYIRQTLAANNGNVMTGLVERLKHGTRHELKVYVEEYLNVPLGIQDRLLKKLSLLIKSERNNLNWKLDSTINSNTTARKILLQWKSGKMSKVEYFASINSALDSEVISVEVGQQLFNMALREGGYSTNKSDFHRLLNCRSTVDASLCSLIEVSSLHLSKENSITIYCCNEKALSLACNGGQLDCDNSSMHQSKGTPCVTSDQLQWSHEGLPQPGLSLRSFNDKDDSNLTTKRLHLLIGDTITLSNGLLDVDYVISVDSKHIQDVNSDGSTDVNYVVVLIDGRLHEGIKSFKCSSGDFDGVSELGCKDNGGNDSDGSESEGHVGVANIVQVRKQFFCVFAVIYRGLVKVINAVSLHNHIYRDQVPIQVICCDNNLAIVNGTNGLLASVVRCDSRVNILTIDNSSLQFNATTCQLTHSADSVVSAVSFNSEHGLLCSGDSRGVICLWSVESHFGTGHLLAAPIQFELSGKIHNLQISPSGMHIAVALWDSLLLLVVSQSVEINQNNINMQYCLYVRSNLDTTMNNIAAKYSVEFHHNCLRVWRVINLPTDSKDAVEGIRVTTWLHPISEQYEGRCRSESNTSASGILPTLTGSSLEQSIQENNTPSLETARDSEPMEIDMIDTHYKHDNTINNTTTSVSASMMMIDNEYIPMYQSTHIDFTNTMTEPNAVNAEVLQVTTTTKAVALRDIYRPLRGEVMHENNSKFLSILAQSFSHDCSDKFLRIKPLLVIFCACFQTPTVGLLSAALDVSVKDISSLINSLMYDIVNPVSTDACEVITLKSSTRGINKWLCSNSYNRINQCFWVDASIGHNILCALYLRHCGNKSVAMEHPWQEYLRTYGASHLRRSSRGLRALTANIRKIDETANIKYNLPHQIGYIVGLQEIYARRVGLGGKIPTELGELSQLRVLSMGNNHLKGELPSSLGDLKHLQRIVLHQNNLEGHVPHSLGSLGCIVNLAGNSRLEHGDDVPEAEREALVELFHSTKGTKWNNKSLWCSHQPVAKWYKVGVLSSHVHSIVMSSNGMEGKLPASIGNLIYLRMIELATMPGLISHLPKELCNLTTLRRLCICRCGLTGRIPQEIGQLVALEELQLFGNQLTGTIPASIGNLTNLKLLSFGEYTGGNNFTPAPLPPCLATLVNLEALFMANCNLKGALPDWIGNLKELRQLDLQRNNFHGSLPATVGQLSNLLYLNIKDNEELTGKLPIRELMTLTKLNRLSLVHCSFPDSDADIEILRNHLPRCKIWV